MTEEFNDIFTYLVLIGGVLVLAAFILAGPPHASKDPVRVPCEDVYLSFVGEASAVELTGSGTITLSLEEDYSSATGNLNVYYTDSLGLERGGFGGDLHQGQNTLKNTI